MGKPIPVSTTDLIHDLYAQIRTLSAHTHTTPAYDTLERPDAEDAGVGAMIYDTDLGKPLWSDGTDWTDATGTPV